MNGILKSDELLTKRELVALEMMQLLVAIVRREEYEDVVSLAFVFADEFIKRGDMTTAQRQAAHFESLNGDK